MDISERERLIRLEAASDDAISDFYRRGSDHEPGQFTEDVLKRAIAEELGKNRVRLPEVPRSFSGELHLPIVTLALSLAFAVAALSLSLHSFGAQEERLFLDPSALFSTESLLIDTLKRQSDLTLAERDRLIADYQARAKIRETYVQALQSTGKPIAAAPSAKAAVPSESGAEAATAASAIPAPPIAATPATPQEATLAALADNAGIDAYYTSRLYATLNAVAEDMRTAQPGPALDALSELESTLKLPAARNSAAARSALRIASTLSTNLTLLSRSSAKSSEEGDSAIAALAGAQKERLTLLGRMASLEAEIELLKSERASTLAPNPPAAAGAEAPIRSTSPSMDLSRPEAPPLAVGPTLPEPAAPQARAPTAQTRAAQPPAVSGRPEAEAPARASVQASTPPEAPARAPAAQTRGALAPAVSAPPEAPAQPPPGSEPAGGAPAASLSAFIGTVSVVAGTTVLIDLVAGARVGVGSTVLLYRPSPSGAGELVAVALVKSVHLSTAELQLRSLARPGEAPRLRDTIYAAP